VTITVNAVNDPPVADPNGPYTGTVGVPVQFDGSGSSDLDGTVVNWMWDFGDGNTGTGVNPMYTYAADGTFTVTLTVTDNGGATDSNTTTATIAPSEVLDLDAAAFRVRRRASITRVRPVGIRLVVRNNGLVSGTGSATVAGVQNGIEVYNVTMAVTDPVGNGRTTFDFPPFTPEVAGDISWTATIDDNDGVIDPGDVATATTRVVP